MQALEQYGVTAMTDDEQQDALGGSIIGDFTRVSLEAAGAVAGAVVVVARALGDELGLAYIHS